MDTAINISFPEMVEIYLVRHGETVSTGTYTGSTDVELSADGRQQARSLHSFLYKVHFDHCFCSPLVRCRETFTLFDVDIECSFAESLKEIDFGDWEGLRFDEIKARYPDQLSEWMRQGEDFEFPEGEKIVTFNTRVSEWFDKLLTNDFNRVLIVAHGGVLRAGICHLLGIQSTRAFAFSPKEGAVSKVIVSDGFGHLEFYNCRD
ncbi:MAG: alpha-ribazole phosphatase [Desulfocapsaceae bacterium]